jgi:cytochrome c oxidase accessory protein FixG
MFDKDTLIISYDQTRGEPRLPHKKGDSWEGRGDCVDCGLCVAVCPTGIDIRNGLQMECIACGLCIDACNGVMDKVGKPRGLVRYDTETNAKARSDAKANGTSCVEKNSLLRPRTFYYATILTLVGCLMLAGLLTRAPYELHALHDRNPLFVHLSSGAVRNSYTVKILNKTRQQGDFALTTPALPDAALAIDGAGSPDAAHLVVPPDSVGIFRVMVTVPPEALSSAPSSFFFHIANKIDGQTSDAKSMFMAGEK